MAYNTVADTDQPNPNRKFQGRVVDNQDPLMKQRIKVVVPNLLEGPVELLPWIGPTVHSKFGITETAVSVEVPVVGSIVSVTFQDGDMHYGMLDGSLHTELTSDLGVLATNYPNRRGWLDPVMNWSYIDITAGMVEFQLHHKSGTQYTTFDDGRVHHLAVNTYHIEAPDIKETAYNTHKVSSTFSTHNATVSHTLRTMMSSTYSITNSSYTAFKHSIATIINQINTLYLIDHASLVDARLRAMRETQVIGEAHVLIRGGRVDINP